MHLAGRMFETPELDSEINLCKTKLTKLLNLLSLNRALKLRLVERSHILCGPQIKVTKIYASRSFRLLASFSYNYFALQYLIRKQNAKIS